MRLRGVGLKSQPSTVHPGKASRGGRISGPGCPGVPMRRLLEVSGKPLFAILVIKTDLAHRHRVAGGGPGQPPVHCSSGLSRLGRRLTIGLRPGLGLETRLLRHIDPGGDSGLKPKPDGLPVDALRIGVVAEHSFGAVGGDLLSGVKGQHATGANPLAPEFEDSTQPLNAARLGLNTTDRGSVVIHDHAVGPLERHFPGPLEVEVHAAEGDTGVSRSVPNDGDALKSAVVGNPELCIGGDRLEVATHGAVTSPWHSQDQTGDQADDPDATPKIVARHNSLPYPLLSLPETVRTGKPHSSEGMAWPADPLGRPPSNPLQPPARRQQPDRTSPEGVVTTAS